jgi:tetratricopeptide (TPR) repeat protein
VRRLLVTLSVVLAATPAAAQSKRYPPTPPDPDREADAHSKIWEGALDPGRQPYEALVAKAKRLADEHIADSTTEAVQDLGRAIALLPKAPEAYVVRGHLELTAREWTPCADDFEAADDRRHDDGPDRTALEFDLGICAARAGRYAIAEHALERAAASSDAKTETWLRLGEVRIAMGKLEEATAALDTALEAAAEASSGPLGLLHFLLAAAYDRERRPGDAASEIGLATNYDHSFASIESPTYPLLGSDEHDYLFGLAYRYGPGTAAHPEFALVYFRQYLKLATDSPWRRRAEDHVRELAALELPLTVERHTGTTMPDLDAAHAALVKIMPEMRACVAKTQGAVFQVDVIRDGPHAPIARDRPTVRVVPSGTKVRDIIALDNPDRATLDAEAQCIQAIVERTPLPVPKELDTYYSMTFLVVAP